MSHHPIIVLADDLTGAAEIAAVAHAFGLRAAVLTGGSARRVKADVIVHDTDTRLLPADEAARRVRAVTLRVKRQPHAGFFKKTDSVLRGPVLAELEACAAALGRRRVLLVPCNPSLGRFIHDGRYFIAGRPLDRTIFAQDPHHPRKTASVVALLGEDGASPVVCLPPASRLPGSGVVIGEADSPADVTVWAGQVNGHTLPAGGADFFRAWLQTRRRRKSPARPVLSTGATLLLSGTATATTTPAHWLPGAALAFHGARPPAVSRITQLLGQKGFAAVLTDHTVARDRRAPAAITRGFVRLARQLHGNAAFRHLLIAGGATAGAILHELGWTKLQVLRVWSPGVVTLCPPGESGVTVTLKPGSYDWPDDLWAALAAGPHTRSPFESRP